MKAACSLKMQHNFYQTTCHYIPEDRILICTITGEGVKFKQLTQDHVQQQVICYEYTQDLNHFACQVIEAYVHNGYCLSHSNSTFADE